MEWSDYTEEMRESIKKEFSDNCAEIEENSPKGIYLDECHIRETRTLDGEEGFSFEFRFTHQSIDISNMCYDGDYFGDGHPIDKVRRKVYAQNCYCMVERYLRREISDMFYNYHKQYIKPDTLGESILIRQKDST